MLAPRSRTAGRCRARRRGCALHAHTHTQRRGASQTVKPFTKTLSRAAHAPVALAASGLDQAVSIAGSRSLQGQAGARSSETHDTSKAGKFW